MKMKKWELLLLLALVAALSLWALWPKPQGYTVTVTVAGAPMGTYPLGEDLRLPVEGANGFSLVLVIQSGQAWVEDAACPDLICQHHPPIDHTGQQIVCLPGRTVIAVTGEEEIVDAVLH